jgi:hypothetical protein
VWTLVVVSGYDGEVLSCGLTTIEEDPPMTTPPTKEEVDRRRTLIDDLKKQVNHGIPKEKREKVFQLLQENLECFAANASKVGCCNISEHNIETVESVILACALIIAQMSKIFQ